MFKLFAKNKDIYAPIAGLCLDITKCKDPTFSSKMLGDGFMILPQGNTVSSPCDGKITSIFPTKHAIGMMCSPNKEILIHIGIDTVKLDGKYFTSYVSIGDKVKMGDPLVSFDAQYMNEHGVDMSTIVILLNGGEYTYAKKQLDKNIQSGEKIIEFESGD